MLFVNRTILVGVSREFFAYGKKNRFGMRDLGLLTDGLAKCYGRRQKMPKIRIRSRLTRCTNFPDNGRMTFTCSLFALIAPRRVVLRAWRVAVGPGAGVE